MFGIALIGYRQLNKAGLFGSVLLGTSLILGLTAVALSGVRSVWLAIPVLLLIFLYLDRLGQPGLVRTRSIAQTAKHPI